MLLEPHNKKAFKLFKFKSQNYVVVIYHGRYAMLGII